MLTREPVTAPAMAHVPALGLASNSEITIPVISVCRNVIMISPVNTASTMRVSAVTAGTAMENA